MSTTFNTKLALTGALALLALGCQGSDDDAENALLAQGVPCEPSLDGGVDVPSSDGSVDEPTDASVPDTGPSEPGLFAEVVANGTGCPAGTWSAELAPDGNSFVLRFAKYGAVLKEADAFAIADCQIAIRLRSPEGQSYAVSDIGYQGHAKLDEGVSAVQLARYYFQGNPVPGSKTESRKELTGPLDTDYTFQGNVSEADLVWSPCGLQRDLNVVTRITVRKDTTGAGTGSGSVDVKELHTPKIVWKKC